MSLPASILIIDDDRGMCETLGDVLRLKGYIAETAGGGREAKPPARGLGQFSLNRNLPQFFTKMNSKQNGRFISVLNPAIDSKIEGLQTISPSLVK